MTVKGISLPFAGTHTGGLATATDDGYIRQLLLTALSDCSNANPFNDIGLGQDHVFQPNTQRSRGQILVRVRKVFEDFERRKLARLNGQPRWGKSEDGVVQLNVSYYNLETDKPEELTL